ncbi:Vacuolar protein sorting-associated protein 29 [Pelomyxa schiedti]|nr:Vacuolar protein sorting-associated protein 29 [Pelomyxa schiedti]
MVGRQLDLNTGTEPLSSRSIILTAETMVLVLVIGDLYIPTRAASLPKKFLDLLTPNKMQWVICTGNLCSKEVEEYFRTLAERVDIVGGDCDDLQSGYPDVKVVDIEKFTVGICHAHQDEYRGTEALEYIQRMTDSDVVITGHTQTHLIEKSGKLFLNPGTATGTSNETNRDAVPTFMVLSVEGTVLTTYSYKLVDDEISVTKHVHKKHKKF